MHATSFNDGWEYRSRVNPFAELGGEAEPFRPVVVPHDAMLAAGRDPSKVDGDAIAWFRTGTYEYRKRFEAPEAWRSGSVLLRFEGIYRSAFVYVNGELAGSRPYGYTELLVDLGELLRYGGRNEIRVEARTGEDSRWYSGGGIYRNVTLLTSGPVHVAPDGVRVTTPDVDDERAVVVVATTVVNEERARRRLEVVTELVDPDGAVVATDRLPMTVAAGAEEVVQRLYVRRPRRWGLDAPDLHTCRTSIVDGDEVLDEHATTFGIRTLQLDPEHGLRLNGETVLLRGACVHHDNGILGAATFTRADERRVELLKAAGFNALRSAHNPMSRAMLDACDRHGVLVMDEGFDSWTKAKRDFDHSLELAEWWERDLESMVAKDFNHPSVVFYSIGNEIFELGNPRGVALSRAMVAHLRALDPTRFITNGVNALLAVLEDIAPYMSGPQAQPAGEDVGINTALTMFRDTLPMLLQSDLVTEKTKEAFATLDVAGYNYIESRYEMDGELFPNRLIVGTETAINFIAGNWRMVQEHGHVLGDFAWTGWDYLGEVGVGRIERQGTATGWAGFMGPYPWLTAWVGDLDITGHRRPASYYREIVFGLRTDPYLAVRASAEPATHASPWTWSDAEPSWTWPGSEGDEVVVEVYADADEVELLLDGAPVGRVAMEERRGELAVRYAPGELTAVAHRGGVEVGRASLRTASGEVRLVLEVDRAEIAADEHDLAYVTVTLRDAAGAVHPAADRLVRIEVEGSGALQGFGSANPCTEESFLDDEHTTFGGRALAAIRPTGAGTISVRATADGCEPATATIMAR